MSDLYKELIHRKSELDHLAEQVSASLTNGPKGRVKIHKSHKCTQFLFSSDDSGELSYRYLKKEDVSCVSAYFQRDYEKKLYPMIKKQQKAINECLKACSYDDIGKIYSDLHEARKAMIVPWIYDNNEFVQRWLSVSYEPNNYDAEKKCFETEKGDLVRSKSEKILADKFFLMGIPYQYEKPLSLSNVIIHPDFTLLNVRTRQVYYYEHFGMMDDPSYSDKAVYRINQYIAHDLLPGRDVLMTFETGQRPLLSSAIEKLIEEYLI